MLSSITPLGERARRRTWGATVAFYAAGATLGGAALGAIVGGFGSLVPTNLRPTGSRLGLILIVLLVGCAALEIGLVRVPLPSPHRQVNEDWLGRYRGWVVGVGFGAQLGFGVVTMITTPVTYVMIAVMFLTHSPLAGLALGAAFGLARALPILATRSVQSVASLRALHVSMNRFAPVARRVAASSMTLLAVSVLISGVVA